jgi:hypothetical protein
VAVAAGPSTLLPLLVTTGVFAAEAASVTAQVCSDAKVANRETSLGLALGDREWLLNDGQIQNPSAQS